MALMGKLTVVGSPLVYAWQASRCLCRANDRDFHWIKGALI